MWPSLPPSPQPSILVLLAKAVQMAAYSAQRVDVLWICAVGSCFASVPFVTIVAFLAYTVVFRELSALNLISLF